MIFLKNGSNVVLYLDDLVKSLSTVVTVTFELIMYMHAKNTMECTCGSAMVLTNVYCITLLHVLSSKSLMDIVATATIF